MEKQYDHVLKRVSVTMTSPITGKPKIFEPKRPKKDIPKVRFSSPTLRHLPSFKQLTTGFTYLCICRRAPELILPFLVVGLAFAAGLAAFMPVVP